MEKALKVRSFVVVLVVLAAVMALCVGCEKSAPIATPIPAETTAPPPTPQDDVERDRSLWLNIGIENDENTVLKDSRVNDDGVRSDTYIYDDAVGVAIERLLPADSELSTQEVAAFLTAEWENIEQSEIQTEEDDSLSYPGCRLFYKTGSNEDTKWNMDLYIQTDAWDYRVHVIIPIDMEEEYAEEVIRWFYAADIVQVDQ